MKTVPRTGVVVLFGMVISISGFCAGKKSPDLSGKLLGKKVIALAAIPNFQIEMPDGSQHNFGSDFQASLTTQLTQSGKYLVADKIETVPKVARFATPYFWSGSVTPSATIRIEVDAITFQTGSRGESFFYGFDDRIKNLFNDGTGQYPNEFPLKSQSTYPSWFGDSFDQKGVAPFDSHSGLDLGDGFQINALFAWLNVKYARYHSELHLKLKLDLFSGPSSEYRSIDVSGDGFFFDVSGAYSGYSAGIAAARGDAMSQAVQKSISSSLDAIDRALQEVPLMAKIDAVLPNGTVLLGTGYDSEVQEGVRYRLLDDPTVEIQVRSSNSSGSMGVVVSGNRALVIPGKVVTTESIASMQAKRDLKVRQILSSIPNQVDTISLSPTNLPVASSLQGLVPFVSEAEAFLKSLVEFIFLPYRVWRYFMYDQTYHRMADGIGNFAKNFWYDSEKSGWAKQIGLEEAPEMAHQSPVVAVLDSGMDYNHPVLHDALWLNSNPTTDLESRIDRYGWDFISGDSRPYDDGYHGTQISSLVSTVAPNAKIMAVKVFNPWGITTSAALYQGFVYAVDHGAQIIVCGWTTRVKSQAIYRGIEYARDHGVIVVAAAGDQGVSLSKWNLYPASYSNQFDNLIVVTGVDSQNQLMSYGSRKANYDSTQVKIAAPANQIRVAEPRMGEGRESSTGLAAAIVAGVLARNLAAGKEAGEYREWIDELLSEADSVPTLASEVEGGRVVRVKQ